MPDDPEPPLEPCPICDVPGGPKPNAETRRALEDIRNKPELLPSFKNPREMRVESLDGLLEPLSRCLDDESARRVVELQVDPSVQARVDALAERANGGLLTAEEQDEYDAFISAAHVITILKIKSRRRLASNGG